jgi:predicted enzyme related to lactoylglutathione lyase
MSDDAPTLGSGKICYLEIPARNVQESARFYQDALGWNVRRRGDGRTAFDDGVNEVSGTWVLGRPPAAEPGLLVYVMVADADATVERVLGAGGEVVQPVDRSGADVVARFRDPAGNVLGVFEQPGLVRGSRGGQGRDTVPRALSEERP